MNARKAYYPPITNRNRLELVMDYEEQFADMPDEIGSGQAAEILGVKSIEGLRYILSDMPEDAPPIDITTIQFGKRTYNRYQKSQVIALRRYRDAKG